MYEPLRCHCGDYKCKNPVITSIDEEENGYLIDPTCNLCEGDMCKEHAHFVREVNRIKEFVCDRCYQMCMVAYQNKQKGHLMQQKVAEFIANLLEAGLSREKIAEMGYSYALALQIDGLPANTTYVPAKFVFKASELVKDAMPEAYKINHERCCVRPIAPTVQIKVDPEVMRHAFRKSEDDRLTTERFIEMITERNLSAFQYSDPRYSSLLGNYAANLIDVSKKGKKLMTYDIDNLHYFTEEHMSKELDKLHKETKDNNNE